MILNFNDWSELSHIDEAFSPTVTATLESAIKKDLLKLKGGIPATAKKVIDPSVIIDRVQGYLIAQIPTIAESMKKGVGGEKFAVDCYREIIKTITEELNKIGSMKKSAIRLLAPSKDQFIKMAKGSDISEYIDTFIKIIDFSFSIGWIDEVRPYSDNLFNFSDQSQRWVLKNQGVIKQQIIDLIIRFVYG